jgi:hypothetical protein
MTCLPQVRLITQLLTTVLCCASVEADLSVQLLPIPAVAVLVLCTPLYSFRKAYRMRSVVRRCLTGLQRQLADSTSCSFSTSSRTLAQAHGERVLYTPETLPLQTGRPRLVVLGTGWAAARLCRDIDPKLYDITVSPQPKRAFWGRQQASDGNKQTMPQFFAQHES